MFLVSARIALALGLLVAFAAAMDLWPFALVDFGWDKTNHTLAFLTLTVAAGLAFPQVGLVVLITAVAACGGVMEMLQGLPTVGREPRLGDMAANMVGAAVGAAVLSARAIRWRSLPTR